MDGSSIPNGPAGADHILYTAWRQTPPPPIVRRRDCRLTRPNSSGVGWPRAHGGPRGLDVDVLWVSLHAGMNTGPVRAGCAYTRPSDWVVSARWVRSCGSSAAGLANEVLYNTRWPLYGGPSLSDTLGQGPRISRAPQKRKFCVCRYMVGTLPSKIARD